MKDACPSFVDVKRSGRYTRRGCRSCKGEPTEPKRQQAMQVRRKKRLVSISCPQTLNVGCFLALVVLFLPEHHVPSKRSELRR